MVAQPTEHRLPTDVQPVHYDLAFCTDLEAQTFRGLAIIRLQVIKETSTLTVNTLDLTFDAVHVTSTISGTTQTETSRTDDEKHQRVSLHFAVSFDAGETLELRVAFHGQLGGGSTGFFAFEYDLVNDGEDGGEDVNGHEHRDEGDNSGEDGGGEVGGEDGGKEDGGEDGGEGKIGYAAATHLEPTAARSAFPCWDEPALKATFAITLVSPAKLVNLSNMPVRSEEAYTSDSQTKNTALAAWLANLALDDGWKITQFDTTPRVSTYLVAWALGPFEFLETTYTSPLSGDTWPLRIYATHEYIRQAQWALDVMARALPLYERVFEIEYPLPKLDLLIAEMGSYAMENWGLIIGDPDTLCLDPDDVDIAKKQSVASTVCHEVAHQWFGNITTMEWWDNLYLNEGFATLMGEVVIPNMIFPEWKLDTVFLNKRLAEALSLDAKRSSHPIEVPCADAEQANQIFDDLSYSKAASVLRMLSAHVGEDVFLRGVSAYLKNHMYGSTVSQDLWDAISASAGYDISAMMHTWVGQKGFPYLTVTETPHGIRVRQDRFLETGPAKAGENETLWAIPLRLLTISANGTPHVDTALVLESREMEIKLDTRSPFKLNAGTVVPVRVLYASERMDEIARVATQSDQIFTADDRIGLVSDAAALARAGLMDTSAVFALVEIFRGEPHELAWTAITAFLDSVQSVWFENAAVVRAVTAFRRNLFERLANDLGLEFAEDEDVSKTLLRKVVVEGAAFGDNPEIVADLKSLFARYLQGEEEMDVSSNLQEITFYTAVKHGGRAEYERMQKIYTDAKSPAQQEAAMKALGATNNPEWAQETLWFALSDGRDQDVDWFVRAVVNNGATRRVAVQFVREHFDDFLERVEDEYFAMYLVEATFKDLTTRQDVEETEAFFADKDTSKYSLVLQQTLDNVRANAAWIERSTKDVETWAQN